MKTILTIFLFIGIIGCNASIPEPQHLNDLQKPIIVIALVHNDSDAGFHGGFGSIILKDSSGIFLTLNGNSYEGEALINSKKIGDTIK